MAHGDEREGSKGESGGVGSQYLHTTSEHGASSITTADAYTSAASSRLNLRHRQFKWTRPFRRKTKSGFWACAFTFHSQSNKGSFHVDTAAAAEGGGLSLLAMA